MLADKGKKQAHRTLGIVVPAMAGLDAVPDLSAVQLEQGMVLGPEIDASNRLFRSTRPHLEIVGRDPALGRVGWNTPGNG